MLQGAALARASVGAAQGAAVPSAAPVGPVAPDEEEEQLRRLRGDIASLRAGIRRLAGSEQGILGELKASEADVLMKQEDLALAEESADQAQAGAAAMAARVEEMEGHLTTLRGEVARRLDALYRMGRPRYLRVILASNDPAGLLSAYRTAAALSSRDARLLARFRDERESARREGERLEALQPILAREQEAKQAAAREAENALERRRALLRAVQGDRKRREEALAELIAAEKSAERIVSSLGGSSGPLVSIETLRSLLDWPASGPVLSLFGRSTDRRFGTPVEHSGLDIDAPFGGEIRSVYDGTVVFAQWLRGYGLTAIVDHGSGYMSVYGHASVLMVQKGDPVRRGQKIGLVGDSGSIRGAYLYFEIRKEGRPVDPLEWLKPR